MLEDYREIICICMGASESGLKVLDPAGDHLNALLSLGDSHSVYAAEISADGKSIAAGSKTGFVYLVSVPPQTGNSIPGNNRCFQGSPILSICSVSDRETVASDVAGNVIVWDLVERKALRRLMSPSGPICSLFYAGETVLAGLSVCGDVLIWNSGNNEHPRIIRASAPPAPYALVRVTFWREADCWVWPDRMGNLVMFDLKSSTITCITAHTGTLYAISTCDGKLISAGQSDGLMKFWQPGRNKPDKVLKVPFGTISLVLWRDRNLQCLIVEETGTAVIYSIVDDELIPSKILPGDSYRTVIGPDLERCQARLARLRSERAEQVCAQIESRVNASQFDGLTSLHKELVDLGYRHLSLWLQAVESEKRGEIIRQLKACRDLAELIERQSLSLPNCLFNYAQLLEKLWQLKEAKSVYQKLSASKLQDLTIDRSLSKISSLLATLSHQNCVIESSIPIPVILDALHILDSSPPAPYALKKWPAALCEGAISPQDFLSRYELLRHKFHWELPAGTVVPLYWLAADHNETLTGLIFDEPTCFLSMVVRLDSDHGHTRLSPVAIVHCDRLYDLHPKLRPHELVVHIESELRSSRWLELLRAKIAHVMRQFVTRFRSQQKIY